MRIPALGHLGIVEYRGKVNFDVVSCRSPRIVSFVTYFLVFC
jgi:hypothetical protein